MDKPHSKTRSTELPRGGAKFPDPFRTPGRQRATVAEEMRQHFRYPISASAVAIDTSTQARLAARASDLGMNGCYLDSMNNLFPVGTPLLVRLSTEGHGFACEARVAYALPGMGMGLMFTRVSPDQAAALSAWIAELRGSAYSTDSGTDEIVTNFSKREYSGDADGAFVELLTLLRRKGVITDSEADGLRRKIAR
jgi:PilZ domain